MADAKQRYTIIYFSEVLNAESKNAESKNATLLIDLQPDTADTITSGIRSWNVTLYITFFVNIGFISFPIQKIIAHKH